VSILDHHARQLTALDARSRRRRLLPITGADFASNDYLGLAASGALGAVARTALDRGVSTGSGGSRLLRGNHAEHEALEAEAAAHFGSGGALFLANGYVANVALFSALPARRDLIVHDELIHASAHDGMKLGRAARVAVRHNDVQAVADAIAAWRARGETGRIWIAVESLYSMEGDFAPIAELIALADRHDAFLIVDEAHGSGVYGAHGEGLAAGLEGRDNVLTLHTCGKALGCEGALISGAPVLIDYLVNHGRGFIFSTAPSPFSAAVARGAIALTRQADDRRAQLQAMIAETRKLVSTKLSRETPGSQIVPILIGDNGRAMAIAAALQRQGFDIRGVRPPTVPPGTARLRLSLTLNADMAQVRALIDAMANLIA
jgi:8-amino-7-oxononanoate synthase